jgi:hypothetical protein
LLRIYAQCPPAEAAALRVEVRACLLPGREALGGQVILAALLHCRHEAVVHADVERNAAHVAGCVVLLERCQLTALPGLEGVGFVQWPFGGEQRLRVLLHQLPLEAEVGEMPGHEDEEQDEAEAQGQPRRLFPVEGAVHGCDEHGDPVVVVMGAGGATPIIAGPGICFIC